MSGLCSPQVVFPVFFFSLLFCGSRGGTLDEETVFFNGF